MRTPVPRLFPGLFIALFAAACATSPLGRHQLKLVSDAQMNQMGVAAYRDVQKKTPTVQDPGIVTYVNCVATAVLRETGGSVAWEITTFDDKQVNAFALPGGKIGVYAGLLKVAQTQDQLAAVIGHEVAHVLAGHSAERVSQQMLSQLGLQVASATTGVDPQLLGIATDVFFLLPHSRTQESEADRLGLDTMARAGFDPRQAVTLWQNMRQAGGGKPPQILSTHPSDDTRIRQLQERMSLALPLYEQARQQGKRPECTR
ncbi:MAG: M48 family metallopeptidase [Nevskiales bacterium]|nr:M48 family metallopeptidase [Nevskiales bacterium]